MTPLVLALLLASGLQDEPPPDTGVTAAQIYGGCARHAARAAEPAQIEGDELDCARTLGALLIISGAAAAAQAAMDTPAAQRFCLPDDLEKAGTIALAQLFVGYVDRHPESRALNVVDAFYAALADKWPCAR